MLNTKRLVEMARKWKRMTLLGKKRILCSTLIADKGHFILYSSEGKRFMVPISLLKSNAFEELLRMAEEEFGLSGEGPITLTCNAAFLEHVLFLVKRGDMERGLKISSFSEHCSISLLSDLGHCEQLEVC